MKAIQATIDNLEEEVFIICATSETAVICILMYFFPYFFLCTYK